MTIDYSFLEQLELRTKDRLGQRNGGREPPGGPLLERRVAALERQFSSIDKTLSLLSEQMKHLATKDDVNALRFELSARIGVLETGAATLSAKLDTKASSAELAAISGKLDTKASATDLAELKGRVARIPTVPTLTSILVFVSLLFAAASWALRHLPPAWTAALQ